MSSIHPWGGHRRTPSLEPPGEHRYENQTEIKERKRLKIHLINGDEAESTLISTLYACC